LSKCRRRRQTCGENGCGQHAKQNALFLHGVLQMRVRNRRICNSCASIFILTCHGKSIQHAALRIYIPLSRRRGAGRVSQTIGLRCRSRCGLQAESWGAERGLGVREDGKPLLRLDTPPHPQPFSRLREKGAWLHRPTA
jgi:hypothetical protein